MIVRRVVRNPRRYSITSHEAYMNRYENIFPSKPNGHQCREFTCLGFNCQCFPVPYDRVPQVLDMDVFLLESRAPFKWLLSVRVTLEDMETFFRYQLTLVQLLKRAIAIVIQVEMENVFAVIEGDNREDIITDEDLFRIVNHADYVDDIIKNGCLPSEYTVKGTTYA